MSNQYYNYSNDLTPGSKVRSEEIDEQFLAITAAFDKLSAPDQLTAGAQIGAVDTGSADSYVVDNGGSSTLVDYQMVVFKPSANNTGASTLALNGATNHPIVRNNGNALEADDLIAGIPYLAIYDLDKTRFVLVGATYQQTQAAIRPSTITDATTKRTLSLTDEGSVLLFTSGSEVTVTVPANDSVGLPVGFIAHLHQIGSGQVTVAGASGVTITRAISLKTRVQYSSLSLIKTGTDTWRLIGDAEP